MFDKLFIYHSIFTLQHPETGEKHLLSNPLTKTQSVEIYDPIIVYPKRLVLLWDTKSENYYQHSMKVLYIHVHVHVCTCRCIYSTCTCMCILYMYMYVQYKSIKSHHIVQ